MSKDKDNKRSIVIVADACVGDVDVVTLAIWNFGCYLGRFFGEILGRYPNWLLSEAFTNPI